MLFRSNKKGARCGIQRALDPSDILHPTPLSDHHILNNMCFLLKICYTIKHFFSFVNNEILRFSLNHIIPIGNPSEFPVIQEKTGL